MKIKEGFILRDVAGQTIVVAVGKMSKNFNRIIKLNSTGKFIWEKLSSDIERDDLVASLVAEYDIDEATASSDADKFIDALKGADILEC